jgi:hypothetical protein
MNKLARLKGCLTLHEVARQLTVSLAGPCKAADVLRLGLEGQLILSVRFLSPTLLFRSCSTSTPGKAENDTVQNQAGERRTSTTTEIFDLPLTGSERASVEARCQSSTRGLQFSALPYEPAYARSRDGDLWQLSSRGLPPDCEIVVRSEALADLEARECAIPKVDERGLGTRERRTFLVIFAGLCAELNIKPGEYGAAKRIASATDRLGTSVSADTIGRIFGEIPEALEWRKK